MNEVKDITNVIFLDMDGVINNDDFLEQWMDIHGNSVESKKEFASRYYYHDGESGYVVPELLERLKRLCEETDCKIVWSSSWREYYWKRNQDTGEFNFNYQQIRHLWLAKGLPFDRFIGCTPCEDCSRFSYVPRGVEIQMWLDENASRRNIGKVAIIDDNEDAEIGVEYERAKFFQTMFQHGLTEEIADDIKRWFEE